MTKKLCCVFMIMFLFATTAVSAQQQFNVDNLTPQEKALYYELQKKGQYSPTSIAAESLAKGIKDLKGIDVKSLTEWRVFITDTIKDVCRDLNVSVNEFIKTPAGAGIAGLIIYQVAGKDILMKVVDKIYHVVFMIPFWVLSMLIGYFVYKKFLATVLVYTKITETTDEKGKKIIEKEEPKRKTAYPFDSDGSRLTCGCFLVLYLIVVNITTLVMIF